MSRSNLKPGILAVALLGACAQSRPEMVPAQPVSQATCPATPELAAPPLSAVGGVSGQPPAPLPRPPAPTFQGRILLPPSTPGESRFELAGCLSLANPTEAEGARFPPTPAPQGRAADEVRVNPMTRGVIIVHELTHACCLKADVSTRLEGERLVVLEQLIGSPCRCTCASTIRTAEGLAPGHYILSLQLAQGGHTTAVREAPFAIEGMTP